MPIEGFCIYTGRAIADHIFKTYCSMEDMIMHTFDLSPLFRTSVGFDRLNHLFDAALRVDEGTSFPPYNIEKLDEESYRISIAIAGYGEDDVEVLVKDNSLSVSGKIGKEDQGPSYLYRGIAGRSFVRRFQLADHIKVTTADLNNGLLNIDLVRELPEEMRPKRVAINTSKTLGTKEAA